MKPLLWLSFLRHLSRHPWQLALSVLGIALGVAVVLAVDLANTSAYRSFKLSVERITGSATHRITAGPQGIPETFYARLRLERGLRNTAPVLTGYAQVVDKPGKLLQVLGVDLFAEAPFRHYLDTVDGIDTAALLTEPNTALLPEALGKEVELRSAESRLRLRAIGHLHGELTNDLIITDISTAQVLLGQPGRLSHIDLILPAGQTGERAIAALRAWLPAGFQLEKASERLRETANLSAAFSLNLTAMSLLALVVGMFLIYNTMTFAVVQRRPLLGRLRAMGVSRREVFVLVLGEALLLGLAGTLLGGLLGIALGSGLVHLVTRTINDLYYAISVREFFLAPLSLAKAAALGFFASTAAAFLPAWEAANTPPGCTLSRTHLEARWKAFLPRLTLLGLLLLTLGGLILFFSQSLFNGFAGLFLLILGCAMLTPGGLMVLSWLSQTTRNHLLLRMALRDVTRHLSRTGIAVAALVVAFSAAEAVGIMVDSFRGGVTLWIRDLVNADLYIAPPSLADGDGAATLHPQVLTLVRTTPGVAGLSIYRRASVEVNGKPVILLATALAPQAERGYRFISGDADTAWQAFERGEAVIISEPLAYRQRLRVGSPLTLSTPEGQHTFRIAAVFLDYGSEHGRILIHRLAYQRYWHDPKVSSAAVYAAPGTALGELRQRLETRLSQEQELVVRSDRDIQEFTLNIFDRTFTITQVLRLMAVAVAFVGVLSALLALQLERSQEFAVLRATGMTSGEIGWLISLHTGFMGFAAGLLAIPVGLLLASVLIFVINRRAFGWSLPFQLDLWIPLQGLGLALLAALLAGFYPLWRLSHTNPAAALRSE